ncbi:MAG: hypothetical protein Q6J44_04905 [Gloeomargarita sp. DG02_4_bins_56]
MHAKRHKRSIHGVCPQGLLEIVHRVIREDFPGHRRGGTVDVMGCIGATPYRKDFFIVPLRIECKVL